MVGNPVILRGDAPSIPVPGQLDKESWTKSKDRWCYYCGCEFGPGELTRDHMIPVSNGGKGLPHNKVPACSPCNSDKGAELMIGYLLRKPFGAKPNVKVKRKGSKMPKSEKRRRKKLMALGLPMKVQTKAERKQYRRVHEWQRRRFLSVLASRK